MSNLEPDLTLEPNWDDLRVPVTSTKLGGSKDPTFSKLVDNGSGSQGCFAYHFSPTQERELYFIAQMPHSWKIGSMIDVHVHWSPTTANAGNVRWGVEYSFTDANIALGNTTLVAKTAAAGGVANKNIITDIADIDMSLVGLSALIMARVYREAAHAEDTYPDNAALLEIDFHFQQDTIGSDQELLKAGHA
jgi:hypothetical protein